MVVLASGHLSAWDARERVDVESVMASAGTSVRDVAEAVVEDAAVFGVSVVTVGQGADEGRHGHWMKGHKKGWKTGRYRDIIS